MSWQLCMIAVVVGTQAAYVKGRPIQEDDTATAGMPQERPLTTPLGGLGNDPDDPEVEPVPTLGEPAPTSFPNS